MYIEYIYKTRFVADVATPVKTYGRPIDARSGLRPIQLTLNSVRMTSPWRNLSMPSRKAAKSTVIWK